MVACKRLSIGRQFLSKSLFLVLALLLLSHPSQLKADPRPQAATARQPVYEHEYGTETEVNTESAAVRGAPAVSPAGAAARASALPGGSNNPALRPVPNARTAQPNYQIDYNRGGAAATAERPQTDGALRPSSDVATPFHRVNIVGLPANNQGPARARPAPAPRPQTRQAPQAATQAEALDAEEAQTIESRLGHNVIVGIEGIQALQARHKVAYQVLGLATTVGAYNPELAASAAETLTDAAKNLNLAIMGTDIASLSRCFNTFPKSVMTKIARAIADPAVKRAVAPLRVAQGRTRTRTQAVAEVKTQVERALAKATDVSLAEAQENLRILSNPRKCGTFAPLTTAAGF